MYTVAENARKCVHSVALDRSGTHFSGTKVDAFTNEVEHGLVFGVHDVH